VSCPGHDTVGVIARYCNHSEAPVVSATSTNCARSYLAASGLGFSMVGDRGRPGSSAAKAVSALALVVSARWEAGGSAGRGAALPPARRLPAALPAAGAEQHTAAAGWPLTARCDHPRRVIRTISASASSRLRLWCAAEPVAALYDVSGGGYRITPMACSPPVSTFPHWPVISRPFAPLPRRHRPDPFAIVRRLGGTSPRRRASYHAPGYRSW